MVLDEEQVVPALAGSLTIVKLLLGFIECGAGVGVSLREAFFHIVPESSRQVSDGGPGPNASLL